MSAITLYTFNKSGFFITVVRDSDTLSIVDYFQTFNGAPDTPQPPIDTEIGAACQSGTYDRYSYFVKSNVPYVYYTVLHNSGICGYSPPKCDIFIKSFSTTPETNIHNNNATANLFAVSSFGGIVYRLSCLSPVIDITNTTGLFTGLAPGDYNLNAGDDNGCNVKELFTILPFDSVGQTSYKYRLEFTDINQRNRWQLRFIDTVYTYDSAIYPKDITGATGSPIIKTTGNKSEDKTTAIIPTQLDINLQYTGLDFTPDEFTKRPEQSWKIELYRNGMLDFQGWLLPDQSQDFYADLPYSISVQATDGIPSLKGNIWGNGSGGNGYSSFQIQQYGLTTWASLVKQCLDQLGYDYGQVILVSSLRFNDAYSDNLWADISTWSDILYNSSGVAVDTYTALDNLLSAMKLSIMQHNGSFYFVNWNDLSYINTPLKSTEYTRSFYKFSTDFTSIVETGSTLSTGAALQSIGYQQPNQPINPPHPLTYDKPYNVEVDINFNTLVLLYENPSFEIGPVEGVIPTGFTLYNNTDFAAFCHNDITAPDGGWLMRFTWTLNTAQAIHNYIQFTSPIVIDQPGKLANISLQWRGYSVARTNTCPNFGFIFIGQSTTSYGWFPNPGSGVPRWIAGQIGSNNGIQISDFVSWNTFQQSTGAFPEPSGSLQIILYADGVYTYSTGGGDGLANGDHIQIDFDMFELTVSDANPASSLQVSESHYETAVTGVPQANLKNIPLKFLTYPDNKRLAGNIFTINDYLTGIVANKWNFALSTDDKQDRLPATISKAIARNYSRPMTIFEGEVSTDYIQFYGMFLLRGYDGVVFMPFSIATDCRNNTAHIIIIECDDSPAQFVYSYVAIYANNARQVTSGG